MNAGLSPTSRTVLLQTPLLTPVAVEVVKSEETGLALRTANLFAFRRQGLPVLVRPISYQGKEGVWVVALAFRIRGTQGVSIEGAAYLNPRSCYDWQLLRHLSKQERFPILFFSLRLRVVIRHATEWTVQQRQDLRVRLAHVRGGVLASQERDSDFERARQELQNIYSIEKLLAPQTIGTVRVSSSFRGAVLE